MRDNSGAGESTNNNHDPTLKDNAGRGGTGSRPGDLTEGAPFPPEHRDEAEQRSPAARGRGEVADTDPASSTDR